MPLDLHRLRGALPVAGQRRTTTYHLTQGRVTGVTGTRGGSPETWVTSVEVHPDGRPFRTIHGNGVTDTTWPDPNGLSRPGSIAITGATKNWNSGAYAWDGAGNITAIGTDAFRYDRLSRLTDATVHTHPTLGAVPHRESYDHDPFGNLLQISSQVGGGAPQTRTITTNTATNRLTSAAYDPAGSVTAWAGQTFDRDPFGMVWRMPGRVLIYGPSASGSDERLWEFAFTDPADGTTYEETYSLRGLDGLVRRQYRLSGGSTNGTWSWLRDPIHRDGKLLAAALPGGAQRHYSLDHLGTPRLITDQNATTLATPAYLPYGEEITPSATGEPLRFTGHERNLGGPGKVDDLDYMHARYCSPHLGRFLRVDPARESANQRRPQSWNRYGYGLGNPVLWTDPDGRTERRGWQAGTVTNNSSQPVYVAYDRAEKEQVVVIAVLPGKSTKSSNLDIDAIIVAPGQTISEKNDGAFKIASGDVSIEDSEGDNNGLILEGDLEYLVLNLLDRAGYVTREDAEAEKWVIPGLEEDTQPSPPPE